MNAQQQGGPLYSVHHCSTDIITHKESHTQKKISRKSSIVTVLWPLSCNLAGYVLFRLCRTSVMCLKKNNTGLMFSTYSIYSRDLTESAEFFILCVTYSKSSGGRRSTVSSSVSLSSECPSASLPITSGLAFLNPDRIASLITGVGA